MASLEKPSGNYDPGEKSSALHYTQSDTEIVQEKIYQYFIERVKQDIEKRKYGGGRENKSKKIKS